MAGNEGTRRGQQRDKPFRDALRMETALAEKNEPSPAHKGSLRWIARQLLERAGEETAAQREVADRLDGKVPQAIVGDDDMPPIEMRVTRVERVIVNAEDQDGGSVPAAPSAGEV